MNAPLLEMRGIGKSFPGVRALRGVSFDVVAGEVHALVGENGAGKSTLMKILAGAQPADEGEIYVDGALARIDGPKAAERYRIGMVYQEFNLVPALDATENIVLGREPVNRGFLAPRAARAAAGAVFADLGIELPLGVPAERLSVAQQQLVEIAKALIRCARLIVMDEPTAALTDRETDRLFELIERLRAGGVAVVYISHRLEELPRIADRITVLRDGAVVETRAAAGFPQDQLIRAMVGRTLEAQYPAIPPVAAGAAVALAVEGLERASSPVHGVSFTVRAGEIVALAGLVGAGRTEIVRAVAAADRPSGGVVRVDGTARRIRGPREAIEAGIALITEDRKAQGLVLGMSVRENTTLAHLDAFAPGGFISERSEYEVTNRMIAELQIRTPGADQTVKNLSGGNQQKVVLAKWLIGTARVFLFDEPTRGIDVGAKSEIYALMVELAKKGAAIVMVSSELPEVLGLAHRILVVRAGKIVAEIPREQATPERVIAYAAGAAA
jgi:ribose transport system ATP-binding protein